MLIEYNNVNIHQTDGEPILTNVNFTVTEGEFIYLIGRVGTGKSSLLKTMYFELDVFEAEKAIVLNHDITSLKRKHIPALRRQMGIIFQDFQLLADRTIRRNLAFVLKATGWKKKDEIEARIIEVLAEVGMEDKIDKMPHELSGGEQQRIAIARAILNKPKIIIADEPTGNLDPARSLEIMMLLEQINALGTTLMVVTHEKELVNRFTKRVIAIDEGKIISDGMDGYYLNEEE